MLEYALYCTTSAAHPVHPSCAADKNVVHGNMDCAPASASIPLLTLTVRRRVRHTQFDNIPNHAHDQKPHPHRLADAQEFASVG